MARLNVSLVAVFAACSLSLLTAATAVGDPASDLAIAESEQSAANAQVSAAQGAVKRAENSLEPVAEKADEADEKVTAAEVEVEAIRGDLVAERRGAATQIETAEANYEDEKSSHETTTDAGIGLIVVAVLAALGALVFSRVGKWPLSKTLTQVLAGGLGVVFVGGLALVVVPSAPVSPTFSRETLVLAAAAKGDPADPASQELGEAEETAGSLAEQAAPLDQTREQSEKKLEEAESSTRHAKGMLVSATRDVNVAQREVDHLEALAEEESTFREEATTVDYGQLIKNPDAYRGDKVVYTGQVLQIQEEAGLGFMLLSVTDEGYGFWTDNIWVDFEEKTGIAEEDIVTVYGKITGSEEYETQVGGSTYVPRMRAKYIDE